MYVLGGRSRKGGLCGIICELHGVRESLGKCSLLARITAGLKITTIEWLDSLKHTGCLDTINLNLEIIGTVWQIASDCTISDQGHQASRTKSQRASTRQVTGSGNVKFILEGLSCSKRSEGFRGETLEDEPALDTLKSDLSIWYQVSIASIVSGGILDTVLEYINLLYGCVVTEKVEMHKCDIFAARVLHDSFDTGVRDTTQGDIERRALIGIGWQGVHMLC
jgi:hypothetical protein